MKLQNILSYSFELNPAVVVDTNNVSNIEHILTNLPPIQGSNLNSNYKVAKSDTPEFLEPTPLIENYCFENRFATLLPSTIFSKHLPSLVPSSSSSCSSDSSTPSSPQLANCTSNFKPQPLSNKAKLVPTCMNKTLTPCRNVCLPHIQPKPNKEPQEISANPKCPVVLEHSAMDNSKVTLSPTMLAASTSAIAACNQNYFQASTESNLSQSLESMDESAGSINQKIDTDFKNSNVRNMFTSYKQGALNRRLKSNASVHRRTSQSSVSAVDRLMFLTKNAHIKRPRNAWIHFRCHYGQALKTSDPTLRAEEISKRASRRWALLNDNEKKPWQRLAERDKQAHKQAFPNYKYCPRRSNSAAIIAKQNAASMNNQIQPKSMMPLCGTFDIHRDVRIDTHLSSQPSFLDKLAESRMMKD